MVDFVTADEYEFDPYDHVLEPYRQWRDDEDVPVHTGITYVEDINQVETGHWPRTGQDGAIVNMYGSEGVNDLHLYNIEPEGETNEQRHFYDEIVYVTEGRGMTTLGSGDNRVNFEWEQNALFHIPPNTPYQHVNLDEQASARLVSQTPLPFLLSFWKDPVYQQHIWDCDYDFWAKKFEAGYYTETNMITDDEAAGYSQPVVWEANFIPDIKKFDELGDYSERGAGGLGVQFPFEDSTMWAHISEFPIGTYKKAHKHGPGAVVSVLTGEGYSLIWLDGMDERIKIDWEPGSLFVPPAGWYHQHFNTGDEPARYMAVHRPRLGALTNSKVFDYDNPNNQIEYVEENPAIREKFEESLAETSIQSKMPDECYTDPNYEF